MIPVIITLTKKTKSTETTKLYTTFIHIFGISKKLIIIFSKDAFN